MPQIPYIGETAAILASASWSINSTLFAKAGVRVGSPTVNITRLAMAMVAMLILNTLFNGMPLPFDTAWPWLACLIASGLIGFSLGDAFLFEALVQLGPRLAMLIMTLWPIFAALMGWVLFNQSMSPYRIMAMVVTLGGIALVVADRRKSSTDQGKPRKLTQGVLLALGGAFCQAVGFILSKMGMTGGGLDPIHANAVRTTAGILVLVAWQGVRGELMPNMRKLSDRRALAYITLGAAFGPIIGVLLGLFAIQKASHIGVASTLMSLAPVMLLPTAIFLDKEKLSPWAIVGTLVSIAGAAALFLLP